MVSAEEVIVYIYCAYIILSQIKKHLSSFNFIILNGRHKSDYENLKPVKYATLSSILYLLQGMENIFHEEIKNCIWINIFY